LDIIPNLFLPASMGNIFIRVPFERALHKCLEDAKLRRIRIHDLRHTYATIRLLRGHNVGDVSYQLGHSSIKITYDVYGHWMPGHFKNEVDELDNIREGLQITAAGCI
jgi:integrase